MIYLDFDGTIADLWPRYCMVFTQAAHVPPIPVEEYREAKRRWPSDRDLAHHFGITLPDDFFQAKRRMLEETQYLRLDRLLLPKEQLLDFFRVHACRILTRRRNANVFFQQLAWLGLSPLKESSIVLHPDTMPSKADYLNTMREGTITLVGDSSAEWEASVNSNIQVILVCTGLQNPMEFPNRGNCSIFKDLSAYINQTKE